MGNKIWIITIMTSLFLFTTNDVFAQIEKIEMGVEGLSCPFCVWGLEKKLKEVKSLDKFSIHLKQAKADLYLKPNARLNIQALKKAVREAGFSAGYMRIRAKGNLVEEKGNILFHIRNTDQKFLVYETETVPKNKLMDMLKRNAEVLMEGNIHEHKDSTVALGIQKVEFMNY